MNLVIKIIKNLKPKLLHFYKRKDIVENEIITFWRGLCEKDYRNNQSNVPVYNSICL